jgi:uncharacterized repeat protein (TIGR01451 family)
LDGPFADKVGKILLDDSPRNFRIVNSTSNRLFTAVAAIICAAAAQVSAQTPNQVASDVSLLVDSPFGSSVYEVIVPDLQSNVLSYDLASGQIIFSAGVLQPDYDDPLFCFDMAEKPLDGVGLQVTDPNGHLIIDDFVIDTAFQYLLPAPSTLVIETAPEQECFFRSDAGVFGLFGQPEPTDDGAGSDVIFDNRFEIEQSMDLEFRNVPEYATVGETIDYQIVLTNTGNGDLQDVAFQEVFPNDITVYAGALSVDTDVQCTAGGGAVCPGASADPNALRFEAMSASQIDMPVGSTLTFAIQRTVDVDSIVGESIQLHAGAVADPAALLGPTFAVDTALTTIVGQSAGLDVVSAGATADGDALADVVVTVLDNEQRPVPNESVSFDSATGGLQVTPASGTTDSSGEVVFQAGPTTDAVDYTVSFTSGALAGNGTVSFFPGPASRAFVAATDAEAVADGNDTITIEVLVEDAEDNPVDSVLVEVTSDDGLTFLPDSVFTDSAGRAVLTATSTTTGTYEPQITVDGVGAFTETVDFVAGAPADLEFVEQPSDVAAGSNMSPAVVVRVVDANGNWVSDDGSTFVEVDLMQGGSVVSNNVADGGVTNGEIEFSALSFDSSLIGTDYYLQAVGTVTGFFGEDSTTFDITDPQ